MSGKRFGVRGGLRPSVVPGLVVVAVLVVGCGSGSQDQAGPADATEPAGPSASASPSPPESQPVTPTPSESPEPPAPPPATGAVLTMADHGRTVSLSVGESVSLRLVPPWVWETPTVRGSAAQVYPVDFVTDPGYQEWAIQAVRPGESTVRAFGDANCPPGTQCILGDKVVQIEIRVTG
ncbi:MAG: hypothetical protein L0Y54_01790 [Sporichthyaceae bacterium]|nr:hypothetical protein [Sporichthyaceae bacterium]